MSRGYWMEGPGGELDYVDLDQRGKWIVSDRGAVIGYRDSPPHGRQSGATSTPRWATMAGDIFAAILNPATKAGGWRRFDAADRAARRGNRFAFLVRQGLRRIALRLQKRARPA